MTEHGKGTEQVGERMQLSHAGEQSIRFFGGHAAADAQRLNGWAGGDPGGVLGHGKMV